jgi:hypothetical protein
MDRSIIYTILPRPERRLVAHLGQENSAPKAADTELLTFINDFEKRKHQSRYECYYEKEQRASFGFWINKKRPREINQK